MERAPEGDANDVLPEDVPVTMPELPTTLKVTTTQQFKAVGDGTRTRLLDTLKYEPATAKQLAEKFGSAPGTISHHLQVLEEAGLVQVVARRLIHGIVAKYYARTARLFLFEFSEKDEQGNEQALDFLSEARTQVADTLVANGKDVFYETGFPHTRLSRERAEEFSQRLHDLLYEFATTTPDPDGQIYGLCTAFFLAPPYLQHGNTPNAQPAMQPTSEETTTDIATDE